MKIDKPAKINVAGHKGLAGSAIVRRLRQRDTNGYTNIVHRTYRELDLLNQISTLAFSLIRDKTSKKVNFLIEIKDLARI